MKIEAGKYYKTRDGRKVGPAVFRDDLHNVWPWYVGDEALRRNDGNVGGNGTLSDSFDLISEWQDEKPLPIRTVTRREIVNGTYGRLYIERSNTSKRVGVDITGDDDKLSYLGEIAYLDATELREAAHILVQIAEALDDKS